MIVVGTSEASVVSRLLITLLCILSISFCMRPSVSAQEAPSNQTKRIWTDEDLQLFGSRSAANPSRASSSDAVTDQNTENHYRKDRDPNWYLRQLHPLRAELTTIEADLKTLSEARKEGKGGTDAVNLGEEPEGVTTEGQMTVLQRRRNELLKRIDDLEEKARHNGILPGSLREEHPAEELASGTNAAFEKSKERPPTVKELEKLLAGEKGHLEDVNKEADLLRRYRQLEAQKEYSNSQPRSRRDPPARLAEISGDLAEKEAEIQEAEQKIAHHEDQLEDLRRHSSTETEGTPLVETESANDKNSDDEKTEAFWRKQFAEIDFKIRIAQEELDVLQREHNVLLVQYYSNPATAMKESVTRRDINKHRKAIEDKRRELIEWKKQRDDLEDGLRHSGGPPAWAR